MVIKDTMNLVFDVRYLADSYNKLITLIQQLDRYKNTEYEEGSTILQYPEMKTLILDQLEFAGYLNNLNYEVRVKEYNILVLPVGETNTENNLMNLSDLSFLRQAKGNSFVDISIRENALHKLDKHDFKIKDGIG